MTEHLTENILEKLRTGRLSPGELISIDDHIATCTACRENDAGSFVVGTAAEGFERALGEPTHLSYEELEAYVDGRLTGNDCADVERHADACSECGIQLRELQEFVGEAAAAPVYPSRASWFSSVSAFFQRPIPILASMVLLLSIGSVIWLNRPANDQADTAVVAPVEPPTAAPESPVPAEIPTVPDDPLKEELALSLNDGGDIVGISKNGELSGYDSTDAAYRSLVKNALTNGRLAIADLRDLKAPAGVLMGNEPSESGSFRLRYPLGKVVETNAPMLSWQAVPGAESYSVEVFDQDFKKVASSGELTTASWKPKLPRGRTYTWQVTAVSGGRVFKAPQRPQPDARFRILDQKTSADLTALRRSHPRSHLLLGTAYARAGLIDDAVRQIQLLSKLNPRSDLPKQLLRQLRSAK